MTIYCKSDVFGIFGTKVSEMLLCQQICMINIQSIGVYEKDFLFYSFRSFVCK